MVDPKDTKTLVDRAKAGDRAAFDELAQTYRPRLTSFIESRMGSELHQRLDADDVLQDALLKAFEMIDRFTWRGEESFLRWLIAIAEHLILNAAQKKRKDTLQMPTEAPGANVSPSKRLQREERFARLQSALVGLTPDQKKAVVLARLEGLHIDEIAVRLDRSPAAVKQLLTRALRQLRRSMGDTESLHLPHKPLAPEFRSDA